MKKIITHKHKLLFGSLLLLTPLVLSLIWAEVLDDRRYPVLRLAQNLAAGRGLGFDAAISGQATPITAVLWAWCLSLLSRSPVSLMTAARVMSGLGWGVTAALIYLTTRRGERPYPGSLSAALLVVHPIVVATLGAPFAWVITLAWLALMLRQRSSTEAVNGRDHPLLLPVLLLLLGLHFDLSTIGWAVLLLASRRTGRWLALLLLLASLTWIFYTHRQLGIPFTARSFQPDLNLFRPFQESELYWLFLPFFVIGLFSLMTKRVGVQAARSNGRYFTWPADGTQPVWWLLLWSLLTLVVGSELAPAVTAVTLLCVVSQGLDWVIRWVRVKEQIQLDHPVLITVVCIIPLFLAQATSLWQRYQARPVNLLELETQAAARLQTESELTDTLFASNRIGYLADRATISAEISQRNQPGLSTLFAELINAEPDYFVTTQSIEWASIINNGWFLNRYRIMAQFADDYVPTSPLTIWQYVPSPYDTAEMQPANIIIGENIKLVGYEYTPVQIAPGNDLYLTLHLQATQPITVGFQTNVNLAYLMDGWVWAWKRELTPRSLSGDLWQPGQIIPERYKLETEDDIPFGAYELQVSWQWERDESSWPIFQDNDTNRLDRVRLGYVGVPPPVDTALMQPVNARFGDEIGLNGMEIPASATGGESFEVVLFWEALRPPDRNYVVFVHLQDESGQLVAAHDGQPMDDRYVTRAWQPGTVVRDGHAIKLPPEVNPGTYDLYTGLYWRDTGERLPVWDAQGEEQLNSSLPLGRVTIVTP